MPKVVIFIPISRDQHLDRLFVSLEALDCDTETTSLLAYVDGDRFLYERVSALVEASKFAGRRCVKRPYEKPTNGLHARRKRIAAIKNESKALIGDCDYVFGIEDDTIVPPHTLSKFLNDYAAYPYAGFIEGVELGRWDIPYVGAWRADDVYEPTKIESLMPHRVKGLTDADGSPLLDIDEIDAGGFYCYLTKREHYMMHEYRPFGYNDMGPDVNFGLFLRQQGFKNYIDWSVSCEHRTRGGRGITITSTTPQQAAMVKRGEDWEQFIYG